MKEALRHAIEHDNLYEALDYIEQQTDALNNAWNDANRKNIETALRLLIQEVEGIKSEYLSLESDIHYHLGRLDGFTAAYEEAYQAEKRLETAVKTLSQHSAKSTQILQRLYECGTMRHSELADAVGSSYSALTNIMKKILLSGAVRSARSGKNTFYYLTETGKRYCESCPKEAYKEEIKCILEDALKELRPKGAALTTENTNSEQVVRAGDSVHLVGSGGAPQPVKIDTIIAVLDQKFLGYTPISQENGSVEPIAASNTLYVTRKEEIFQNAREAV